MEKYIPAFGSAKEARKAIKRLDNPHPVKDFIFYLILWGLVLFGVLFGGTIGGRLL
jgi:hypothetical protein